MTIRRSAPSISSSDKCDSLASGSRPQPSNTSIRSRSKEEDPAVVNAKIEAQLKRDNEAYKKEESRLFKVLLLGQAGSGKSTTLKNFRMEFTPDEWERERLGWRAIVQLNIVRQILTIIHLLESELEGGSTTSTDRDVRGVVDDAVETQISGVSSTEAWKSPVATSMEYRPRFTQKHRNLITWLGSRLPEVEHELKSWLTPHSVYYSTMIAPLISATPFEPGEELDDDMLVRKKVMEYTFRSWRDVLDAAPQLPTSFSTTTLTPTVAGNSKSFSLSIDGLDMPTQAIANLRKDIKALWSDADVRAVVKWRRLEIPDSIGFDSDAESKFLDDIDRIAQVDYQVSDQDIVCARLKTVGIQEYTFKFETGLTIAGGGKWSWRVYDVGGCRTMRKAWLPYFDNVQLIIFLAPVSAFDECLEEDPRVNRLHDSIILWSCICETALLANTQIILFLNKCDLLQRKLKRGVRVAKYLSSYGERPNAPKDMIRYIREKFKTIQAEKSPTERPFTAFPTTVTDTSSTAFTLRAVRDNVVRQHLASTHFM